MINTGPPARGHRAALSATLAAPARGLAPAICSHVRFSSTICHACWRLRPAARSLHCVDLHDFAIARSQGGAFKAQQARPSVRWEHLRELQEAGLVIRESRTLFRLADAGDDNSSRLARAELAVGRPLIACHNTAADLHRFGVLPDPSLHVTTMDARSIKPPPQVVVHQMTLRSPVVRMAGLLVVDPADTAIDMAASAASIDVLAVLDAALASGVRPQQLSDAVDRAQRLRGIVQVRGQLCRASPKAESPMESRSRYRIYEAELPEPELQIMVPIRTGGFRTLDMGWRRARIGLEFDGQEFHAGDGSLDRDRQAALI